MIIGPPPKFHGTRDILALIGDRDITDPLDELADQLRAGIPDRDVRADVGRLRLLDAALWMYAPKRARR